MEGGVARMGGSTKRERCVMCGATLSAHSHLDQTVPLLVPRYGSEHLKLETSAAVYCIVRSTVQQVAVMSTQKLKIYPVWHSTNGDLVSTEH